MEISQEILKDLDALAKLRRELPEIGSQIFQVLIRRKAMSHLDFIILGIVKRCLSISHGIDLMVRESNMTCARALVRMQLDTVLRFGAFSLSDDPEQMAKDFMDAKPINKMKDRDGKKMTDSYLVEKMGEVFPWMPTVYKYTSGYIHFSERQLYDGIHSRDTSTGYVTWAIHEQDSKFPESSWVEVVQTAHRCLLIIKTFLLDHLQNKEERIGSDPETKENLRQQGNE
ncbi:MAG: hypothetical protein ACLQPD_17695 [Desulfomonilaceae bacterium]